MKDLSKGLLYSIGSSVVSAMYLSGLQKGIVDVRFSIAGPDSHSTQVFAQHGLSVA